MVSWILLELTKLRRTSLLWVGVAAGLLAILVSFYLAAADRMTQYTVDIFMGNLIANNQSSLFPFVAVLGALARLLANNLCLYAAVLPVTALTAQFAGGYVAGTVFAVVYSFCSIPLSGHGFAAFYPISAGSVLMGLDGPAPTASQYLCAGVSLGGTLLLGLLFTVTARDRTEERQRKPSQQSRKHLFHPA